jgi:hypothetical protein
MRRCGQAVMTSNIVCLPCSKIPLLNFGTPSGSKMQRSKSDPQRRSYGTPGKTLRREGSNPILFLLDTIGC